MPLRAGARRRPLLGGRSLRRSEELSLERIFHDHHQEIYRYCLAIVRNAADAEDALGATMSAAVRALPDEEREIAIRPWLYRVAHNEAISIIRRRRERPSEDAELETGAFVDSAAVELEQRERLRTLVADLRSLPERQRSALIMRELSGLSYAEIAEALGCGEGAARQTVYEARTALSTRAEGREMECEQARRAISDGDRRRLRGRKLKAHLSGCEPCRDFRAGIEARSSDLRALYPPIPAAAGTALLAGIAGSGGGAGLGAGSAAAGTAGVGTGAAVGAGGLAGGVAVKGASLVAAAAIAAGAADLSGGVELPGPVDIGGKETAEPAATETPGGPAAGERGTAGETTGAAGKPGSERAREARVKGEQASSAKGGNGKSGAPGQEKAASGKGPAGRPASGNAGNGNSNAGGNPSAPGGGKPESPPQAGGAVETTPPATPSPAPEATPAPPAHSNSGGAGSGGTLPVGPGVALP